MKIIFTDLDGSLLDHSSYSFEPALESLLRIKELGIPLILCSSKTKAEMELYSERLQIKHPFIAENGSAIYFPLDSVERLGLKGLKRDGDYGFIELGMKRSLLKSHFSAVRREGGFKIRY